MEGRVDWTRSFPADEARPNVVAASAPDGTIALVSSSGARLTVRRLDGAGTVTQQRDFAGTGPLAVEAIAIGVDGSIVFIGYGAALQLGAFNTAGSRYLAAISADGTPRSVVPIEGTHDRVWLDGSRVVRAAGGYRRLTVSDHALVPRAAVDLDATSVAVAFADDGSLRIAYTKASTLRFASLTTKFEELRWLGTRGAVTVEALAISADDIVATGTIAGAIDSVEGNGVFIAGRFVRVIDGAEHATAIVARDAGRVTVGGLASDPVDVGGTVLGRQGCERDQSFIATLDGAGAITSSIGLAGAVSVRSLVVLGPAAVAVASADAPLETVDAAASRPSVVLAAFR